MIRRFVLKIIVSALALWAADYLLAGFAVASGLTGYLLAGIVLGALNTFVRPILKLVSLPLILITFGLFTFVINAALLWFVARSLSFVTIADWTTLLSATFIISIVQTVLNPKKS